METVSCFLLISLSCYFYFSATFLIFSIHSLVNIRTRDFHVGFYSLCKICASLAGILYLVSFPIFFVQPCPFCPVSLESTSWCWCLCSFNYAQTFLRQVEAILGCSVTEMLHSWVAKICFMCRWLLWQGCVLQRGWAGCCLWEHMNCRGSGIPQDWAVCPAQHLSREGMAATGTSVPISELCLEIIPALAGIGIWLPRTL